MTRGLPTFLLWLLLALASMAREPADAVDAAAVRQCAADALSRYVRPHQGKHRLQAREAAPGLWIEIEGLRIGDVAPMAPGETGPGPGIDAACDVVVATQRHRRTHPKLRRWSDWRSGPCDELPAVIRCVRKNGAWHASSDAFSAMRILNQQADGSSIPRDSAAALPPGRPLAGSGSEMANARRKSIPPLVSLAVIAAVLGIAIVIGRVLANRGIIRMATPSSASIEEHAGFSHASVRRRESLLNPTEQRWFELLREAANPDLVVCPKVPLAAVFEALPGPANRQNAHRLRSALADFVVCESPGGAVRCVVCLPDPAAAEPHAFLKELCAHHRLPVLEPTVDEWVSTDVLRGIIRGLPEA